MPVTKIDNLPPAPDRRDPDNFPAKGDALMSALDPMVTQINTSIDGINSAQTAIDQSKTAAQAAASTAAAQASIAESASKVVPWVSGTTYTINSVVISQVNFQTYRKRTTTTGGTTDPANDTANWRVLANGSNIFVPVVVTGNVIDLNIGSFFTKTVTANSTLDIINCPPTGCSFTIELTMVAGSVSFVQASAIKTSYDKPIVLDIGKTHELMFLTSNGGGRYKLSVGESYTT